MSKYKWSTLWKSKYKWSTTAKTGHIVLHKKVTFTTDSIAIVTSHKAPTNENAS
jgi:hypothetical protein